MPGLAASWRRCGPVDDWATAALMEGFYGAGDVAADPARALAEAQGRCLRRRRRRIRSTGRGSWWWSGRKLP